MITHISSLCFTQPQPPLQAVLFTTNGVIRLNPCLDHTGILSEEYQRLKKCLWIKVEASHSGIYIPSPSDLIYIKGMPSGVGFH